VQAQVSEPSYATAMTPRFPRAVAIAALSLVVAACGSTAPPPSAAPSASGGPSIVPIQITDGFRVGDNRVLFTLTDATAQNQVAGPTRTLTIGYNGPNGATIPPAPQTFIWAIENVNGVYVGDATFPTAGPWTADFTTAAPGSPAESMTFSFDVRDRLEVVSPGDPAPSVTTPTLADVGGDVAKISTDATPVKRFYETSEADALAAKKPFVLVFATPKFCQSAVCGPTLDKLKPVAAAHPEMTFINVEPYQLKDDGGQLQPVLDAKNNLVPVDATIAFKLSTEPYVFVVAGDGTVTASFELVFSPDEIESAIQKAEKGS
jgi:hypothetical protein